MAFLVFEASLLFVYFAPIAPRQKILYAVLILGTLMPFLGTINGYYLEIAIQIGIFAAL
ncbi:MAG: branched-chain amino acid ABC transporter permease, partial [Candidatus Latescibacteria bacterium]|nr:branched-chain amino acid ABC transporter permease [Candidatus Latescibacterota bacterium]NIO02719.1 branched-chain amino acid ABC transporter permease [Candidatus Latescibacterota bacterium]